MIPPSRTRRTSRFRRLVLLVAALLIGTALFRSLGRLVTAIDPLRQSDAMYVLGGSRVNRAVEAARLYREGYAPRIVLSPGNPEYGEAALEGQGIHIPNDAEIDRDVVLAGLGVPATAVIVLPTRVDNTAQEADAIKSLADAEHWSRVIVITDRSSTRRAGYAFRRVLGARVAVTVTCNRDDPFDPARWWKARWSVRTTFYEAPKLFAYWVGLRG